jgi:putative acetyltransferase
VRAAKAADIPAMAAVAERSYGEAFAAILEADVLATRNAAFFAERFRISLDRMCVAEDDAVCGFTLVTDAHIDMLFVDPAKAGRGVGSFLLQHAEANGARTLECFRDNASARAFYEKHGWTLAQEYEREFLGWVRSFASYAKEPNRAGGA